MVHNAAVFRNNRAGVHFFHILFLEILSLSIECLLFFFYVSHGARYEGSFNRIVPELSISTLRLENELDSQFILLEKKIKYL